VNEIISLRTVEELQRAVSAFPQVEFDTQHYFADGMYCRVLPRAAGTLIVGKVHKKEHFYMVVKGSILIISEGKRIELSAPSIVVSQPGTKRAVFALEDSVCLTVHRTDKTDLAEIEAELVEDAPDSAYGPGNILKSLEYKS